MDWVFYRPDENFAVCLNEFNRILELVVIVARNQLHRGGHGGGTRTHQVVINFASRGGFEIREEPWRLSLCTNRGNVSINDKQNISVGSVYYCWDIIRTALSLL